jgi:hypothetical protein
LPRRKIDPFIFSNVRLSSNNFNQTLLISTFPSHFLTSTAPVSFKLAQLNTEIPSTINLAERKEADLSDYAGLVQSQKQLFIDQDPRKNRDLTRSGGYSLRDASSGAKVEASSDLQDAILSHLNEAQTIEDTAVLA